MIIDIMLDFETLGTGPCPVLLSMSAVAQDRKTKRELDHFEVFIDLESQTESTITTSTVVDFWFNQPDIARLQFQGKQLLPIDYALTLFTDFYAKLAAETPNTFVWGNGAVSDNNWLINAYGNYDTPCPIPHWAHRCLRTLRDTALELGYKDFKRETKFHGVPHNGLDDCRFQLSYLNKFLEAMASK